MKNTMNSKTNNIDTPIGYLEFSYLALPDSKAGTSFKTDLVFKPSEMTPEEKKELWHFIVFVTKMHPDFNHDSFDNINVQIEELGVVKKDGDDYRITVKQKYKTASGFWYPGVYLDGVRYDTPNIESDDPFDGVKNPIPNRFGYGTKGFCKVEVNKYGFKPADSDKFMSGINFRLKETHITNLVEFVQTDKPVESNKPELDTFDNYDDEIPF